MSFDLGSTDFWSLIYINMTESIPPPKYFEFNPRYLFERDYLVYAEKDRLCEPLLKSTSQKSYRLTSKGIAYLKESYPKVQKTSPNVLYSKFYAREAFEDDHATNLLHFGYKVWHYPSTQARIFQYLGYLDDGEIPKQITERGWTIIKRALKRGDVVSRLVDEVFDEVIFDSISLSKLSRMVLTDAIPFIGPGLHYTQRERYTKILADIKAPKDEWATILADVKPERAKLYAKFWRHPSKDKQGSVA